MKKTNEILTHQDLNDDNNEVHHNDANIMVINYQSELDDEEHLDMIDYTDDDDGGNKELVGFLTSRLNSKYIKMLFLLFYRNL